jgi:hypothetical protein
MVSIGIFEVYTAFPAYRDGYPVEVYMNDGSIIMIVIRVFPVIRRQMHVLVWRHKERQQQRESHRKYGNTTHGGLIMHN